jgi:hypothetical protein
MSVVAAATVVMHRHIVVPKEHPSVVKVGAHVHIVAAHVVILHAVNIRNTYVTMFRDLVAVLVRGPHAVRELRTFGDAMVRNLLTIARGRHIPAAHIVASHVVRAKVERKPRENVVTISKFLLNTHQVAFDVFEAQFLYFNGHLVLNFIS